MRRRLLGPTDLAVSPLGLGTVQLGMRYGYDNAPPPSDSDVLRLIHHALDSGINFLDTAAAYGRGEELVGKACARRHQALDRPSRYSSSIAGPCFAASDRSVIAPKPAAAFRHSHRPIANTQSDSCFFDS